MVNTESCLSEVLTFPCLRWVLMGSIRCLPRAMWRGLACSSTGDCRMLLVFRENSPLFPFARFISWTSWPGRAVSVYPSPPPAPSLTPLQNEGLLSSPQPAPPQAHSPVHTLLVGKSVFPVVSSSLQKEAPEREGSCLSLRPM